MNPANFANMASQGMVPQGHQGAPQPGGQQRGPIAPQAVQQQIFRMLSNQQTQQNLQGWQAGMQIPQRVHVIFQLVSQLRLIQAEMNIEQAVSVAIGFEQRTFFGSPDRATYDQQCRAKMGDIARTRSNIAKSVQQQVQNGQPQVNMGQPQAQMQGMAPNPSQIPMQQRFPNNQIPRLNQPPAMVMPNQQQQMLTGNPQASIQAMPQNTPQIMPPQGQFTQHDMQEIARLSHHMAQTTPPEQLSRLREQLNNNPQRQQLLLQGIDPLAQLFKQQATRKYVEMKRQAAQRNGQLGQGPNGINPEQSRPTSQNSARTQGPQAAAVSAPQGFDPSFMGNVDQIMAQQHNALRLQEAGQVVVPASNGQGMGEQQRGAMRATPQQPKTPNVPQQSPAFWNAQGQQSNGQPAGQIQNQAQPNNFPTAATPIPAHLQGQVGGLNTPVGRMQQQDPNMPNLNRGVGAQNQTPQPQNTWPQQGTPQMQQTAQGTPNPQQNNPNGAPQRPRPPPGKMNDAQTKQYIASLPDNERRSFLTQLQQQHKNQAAGQSQVGRVDTVAMQMRRSQGGQASSPAPTQAPGRAVNGAQLVNGLQLQQAPVHQPGQPQRPSQPQGDATQAARQRAQVAAAQSASGSLTIEVERQMDNYGFPPGILNANNALSKLPQAVKTWGQLKAWVKENTASLPAGSEQKLRGLQGLHYQSMSRKQQPNQQQPGLQPTAPMIPRPNQQPVPAQPQMPNLAQPTVQDIYSVRTRYPQLQSMPEEQVKHLILKQRHDQWVRARQQGLNAQQQTQIQLVQQPQPQLQQQQQQQQQQQNPSLQPAVHPNQPPHAQVAAQRPQPQQPKQVPQAKEQSQAKKAPQAPMQGQATNKGIKRGSSDEVVEVPDPKITQQQRSQAVKPPQKTNVPNMRPDQATQMAQEQKARLEAEQRMRRAQSTQAQQGNQAPNNVQAQLKTEESIRSEARLKELANEVARSTPPRQPVPMDMATRSRMIQKLAAAREMVIRMERFLPLFFRMFNNEESTRDLIRTRLLLVSQYKDSEANPVDHFTISAEELDKSFSMLQKFYTFTMQRVNLEKAKGSAPQNAQGLQPPQQPGKEPPPVLSAANLQQHQNNMQAERQASVQKSHNNSNRAPPAPTSDKPPYTWLGAQSPHGIPMYGPNELTQDNLKLPTNKKRKTNNQAGSAASTPAQQALTPLQKPSPLTNKIPSPEVQRLPAPTMLKCPVPTCQSGAVGFANQGDLDKHLVAVHEPKEPVIEDPFQFALEQMRFALNLDDSGKAKPKTGGTAAQAKVEVPGMKKSSSTQDTPVMKQETATPMSRAPTHTGPSPASNLLLKTPQAMTNIKTPVSETKSLPKDAAKGNTPVIVTYDPWADSLIQPDTIREAFSGLSTLNGPKSWTKIQDYHLTPESMSSDNTDKNSPRPSDISENDLVKINMDFDDKNWIPISWSDPMMEFEELDLGRETLGRDMMEWETMFGETVEEAEEKAKIAQKKYLRDPHGPTEEWLKVYKPE